MRKSNCFTEQKGDYSVTYIKSGFKGAWLVVFEDPTYDISVRYANEEEESQFCVETLKLWLNEVSQFDDEPVSLV